MIFLCKGSLKILTQSAKFKDLMYFYNRRHFEKKEPEKEVFFSVNATWNEGYAVTMIFNLFSLCEKLEKIFIQHGRERT